jgi:UDP-glucose 4-epimerase
MNNILFIGGAGFIGSNLLRRFVEDVEYNVFVYEPSFANVQRLDVYGDSVRLIRGTLGEFDLICLMIETHKIDTIVHLVSTLVPGSSYEDYINEFKNVVFPTVRLLTYCADNNIKFIYFSSGGTIYGNSIGEKFVEKDAPAPISYYGLTKQSLENSICFEQPKK